MTYLGKWAENLTIAVRITCVLALVMVGFGHKPVVAAPLQVQFSAYILPDGTLPTLCVTDNGDQQPKGTMKDHGCDACRLAAMILTPAQPDIEGQAIAFSTVVRVFERQHRLVRAIYPPSSGPRAPPQIVDLA